MKIYENIFENVYNMIVLYLIEKRLILQKKICPLMQQTLSINFKTHCNKL